MPHLTQKPGDTVRVGAWWYRSIEDYEDTAAEYARDEYRDDDRTADDDDDERD